MNIRRDKRSCVRNLGVIHWGQKEASPMSKETDAANSRFLKTTEIFHDIPLELLTEAAGRCRLIHPRRGTILYHKDDPANSMYFLKQGYVMESVYYGDSVDIITKIKCPGDYFGETAVMTDMAYLNTALVTEDSTLVVMPKHVFLRLAHDYYSVCRVVIRELAERLANSAQNHVNAMYLDAPGRLAFTLLNLTTGDGGCRRLEIRVTQSALAASAGMARQTAAKILGEWRKEGWISTDRGKLLLLDIDPILEIITNSEMRC